MVRNVVVAVLDREHLSGALAAIHRSGLGHNARVLDSSRGDLAAQARRANIPIDPDILTAAAGDLVVVVHAAAHRAAAGEILARAGARDVYLFAQDVARIEVEPHHAPTVAVSPLIAQGEAEGPATAMS